MNRLKFNDMGFVVLHLQKAHGTDAATTAHIERTVMPSNADPSRKHLNEKLIDYPEGVANRTQAIQHRLDTAALKRKIGNNQVRAIHINLSGSPEEMKEIVSEGRLNDWCADNVKWLRNTFGRDNIVSADLHMDETTPHIHATLVPIVTGERRKAKAEQESGKKKYRKKSTDTARLCADDVMTREKLKAYQDTYAEAMAKYGLQRGIDGSEARHTTTQEYYRELFAQKDVIAEKVETLKEEESEVYEKVRDLYDRKDEAREKFLVMDEHLNRKKAELSEVESRLEEVKNDLDPDNIRNDLNLIYELFPAIKETIKWLKECLKIGFSPDQTYQLVQQKPVQFTGELYSEDHKRRFKAKDVTARLESDPEQQGKLRLTIDGIKIADWFRNLARQIERAARTIVTPKASTGRKI